MHNADLGKLILRLALGLMLLLHGVDKLQTGVGWISGSLQGMGLPGFFAYGVFIGEVIAPVMIVIGYYTRIGALLVVGNMLAVLLIAHMNELFALGKHGGWAIEVQAFYLFNAVALFFLGSGKYAMRN